jgi:hypothetical protein
MMPLMVSDSSIGKAAQVKVSAAGITMSEASDEGPPKMCSEGMLLI